MAELEAIELRFTGAEMRPEIVRASDLGDVLRAIDEMIEAVAQTENLVSEMSLVTSLTLVSSGSLALRFTPSDWNAGKLAWQAISTAVSERLFHRLPRRATRAIRRVVEFGHRYNCDSELRLPEPDRVLATLPPDLVVVDAPLIVGETTLYGQVIRVGGRKPKVLIAAFDHSGTIACDVSQDIARILGGRLYTDIAVAGTAAWNSETLKIETFRIEQLLPYQRTSLANAFREMSERFGKYYDALGDVDDFMSSVRGDKE